MSYQFIFINGQPDVQQIQQMATAIAPRDGQDTTTTSAPQVHQFALPAPGASSLRIRPPNPGPRPQTAPPGNLSIMPASSGDQASPQGDNAGTPGSCDCNQSGLQNSIFLMIIDTTTTTTTLQLLISEEQIELPALLLFDMPTRQPFLFTRRED